MGATATSRPLVLAAILVLLGGTAAEAGRKLTVMLDWFVNPDHAALVIAKEKGYFDEVGLDVEFMAPADPTVPPKLVAAGKADLAVTYQPQFHMQVAQGLPLVRVGSLVDTPLNCLVVMADGLVKTLRDLKGRKVGYSVGGFEEALLGKMLAGHDLTLSDVTLVNVNFSLSSSLLSGQVDAVIGAFRNFELAQMDLEGRPGHPFLPEEEGVPLYEELILVAHPERVGDPALRRFLGAVEKAVAFLSERPDEGWQLFVKAHPDLDDELNRRAWRSTLPLLARRPAALDHRRYERFAAFMVERGLIQTAPPVASYTAELGGR